MKSKKKKLPKKYVLTFVKVGERKILKLYRVIWTDHAVSGDHKSWRSIDDVKVKTVEVASVGFLVDEDATCLALAQNVGNNGTVGEITTIVKSCIVSKTQL